MKTDRLAGLVGFVLGFNLVAPCEATVMMQLRLGGSTATLADVAPGGTLSLDVVASISPGEGVLGNLDAFTYRTTFPNEEFTLVNSTFAAPFDNTIPPAGSNGSIPLPGAPFLITVDVDSGSPGATPLAADLYRTTASVAGIPATGSDVVIESVSLIVPNPPPGSLPQVYAIRLNVLEAVDNFGTFHTTDNGLDFLLTVVPEPLTTALMAGSGLLAFAFSRRFLPALRTRLAARQ